MLSDFEKKAALVEAERKRVNAEFGITELDIILRKRQKLKELLKENIKKCTFKFLIEKAKGHSKIRNQVYINLEGSLFL